MIVSSNNSAKKFFKLCFVYCGKICDGGKSIDKCVGMVDCKIGYENMLQCTSTDGRFPVS